MRVGGGGSIAGRPPRNPSGGLTQGSGREQDLAVAGKGSEARPTEGSKAGSRSSKVDSHTQKSLPNLLNKQVSARDGEVPHDSKTLSRGISSKPHELAEMEPDAKNASAHEKTNDNSTALGTIQPNQQVFPMLNTIGQSLQAGTSISPRDPQGFHQNNTIDQMMPSPST